MSAEEDLVRRTLSETIALHERVRQANLQPVLDAAAAIAESFRGGGKLLLFGISTSGRSPNVLAGLTTARKCGLESWR